MTVHLRFLGTGASGGTPGDGTSHRRESSALLHAGEIRLLLDASRDLEDQLDGDTADQLTAVVLTHGHRDASGGIPALARLRGQERPPLPVLASPETLQVLGGRYSRLDHIEPVPVEPGEDHQVGRVSLRTCDVPHADRKRFRTYGWRLTASDRVLIYASDVAEPTDDLRALATGADLLVVDGAMYRQSIFSHLRIDEDLPVLCGWEVDRILLTQIGRTAPPHDELRTIVADLCDRASPAHDGLTVEV